MNASRENQWGFTEEGLVKEEEFGSMLSYLGTEQLALSSSCGGWI